MKSHSKSWWSACGAAALIVGGLAASMPAAARADREPAARLAEDGHADAVTALAEYTSASPGQATDELLRRAGFGPGHTAAVAGWNSLSAVRKVEVAVHSAGGEASQGGQRLLALMAHDLARQHESAAQDPWLAQYLSQPEPSAPPNFSPVHNVAAAPRLQQPGVQRAVIALAGYTSSGGPLSVESLIHRSGASEAVIYDHLRNAGVGSAERSLIRFVSRLPVHEQEAAIRNMAEHAASIYPTVAEEHAIRPYLGNRQRRPFIIVSEPPPPPSPIRPSPGPSAPPPPDIHNAPWYGVDPPSGADMAPSRPPRWPGSGGGGGAATRFTDLMASRRTSGAGIGFRASTRGGMSMRLGGVVFGNLVRSGTGTERPAQLLISDVVTVVGQSGRAYVFEGAEPTEACLAVKLAARSANFAYNLVGLTDNVNGKFNVLIHPTLANTDLGRDLVLVDALPINMTQTVRGLTRDGDPRRAAVNALLARMEANPHYSGTWQTVDVETEVTLVDGIVRLRPVPPSKEGALRASFIEMRPVTDLAGGKTGFDLDWAKRFRRELPTIATLYPPFNTANRFARTLAAVRWVAEQGGQLPTTCKTPAPTWTPDAIRVTNDRIEWTAAFDVYAEHCAELASEIGRLGAAKDGEAGALRESIARGCVPVVRCVAPMVTDRRASNERTRALAAASHEQHRVAGCVAKELDAQCRASPTDRDKCIKERMADVLAFMMVMGGAGGP